MARQTSIRSLAAYGLLLLTIPAAGCEPGLDDSPSGPDSQDHVLRFGAEALADRDFDILLGKRVGLITNHTAVVDSAHLIDLLHEHSDVTLAALFGPEHGLRGAVEAGDKIGDGTDSATGVPVYSLYGQNRRPPDSALEGLDVLVFDIQDVGARFYTFISTMGMAMQSAAGAELPFVVLDRPNPLGSRSEGTIREPEFESFVGKYPIPIVHGLTVGELATRIQSEAWLDGLEDLDLTVVDVEGWDHSLLWPDTGREWIPTSPNIPDFETALIYPGTCLFEGTIWSEGRGTLSPFKLIGYPGVDGQALADELNGFELPGVRFEAARFTPESIPGMASNPKHEGSEITGIRVAITDPDAYEPVRTGIQIVRSAYRATPQPARAEFFNKRWFDLLAGTSSLRESILETQSGTSIED